MQAEPIATYELVGRRPDGPAFPVRVRVYKPRVSERMAPAWTCQVEVEPLWSSPFEIYGEGSLQSLCLGLKHAVQMLALFTEQEGTLEYPDGGSFEPSAFGFKLLSQEGEGGVA